MYPFKVVLVGCGIDVFSSLRGELANYPLDITASYDDVGPITRQFPPGTKNVLFIVAVQAAKDLEPIQSLTALYRTAPILALTDIRQGTDLVLSALRAGAAQVVLLPLQPMDMRQALDRIALPYGYTPARGIVIALTGVVGGSGATITAINLAHEIAAHRAQKCILAELALRLGLLAMYLNLDPPFSLTDAFQRGSAADLSVVREMLIPYGENLSILTGPRTVQPAPPIDTAALLHFITLLTRLAAVIVLDVPCTYDERYFALLEAADHIVLLAEQKVPSIRALRVLLEAIERGPSAAVADNHHIVINRYHDNIVGFRLGELAERLRTPRILSIANDTPAVRATTDRGRPLAVDSPRSPIVADVRALADQILGKATAGSSGTPHHSWLGRLFGRD